MLRISSFATTHNLRRIEWIGPLLASASMHTQPRWRVFMSEVDRSVFNLVRGKAFRGEEARVIQGSWLPFVKVGSIWKGRNFVQDHASSETLTFRATAEQLELRSTTDSVPIRGRDVPLARALCHNLPPRAAENAARGYVVVGREVSPEYDLVIIPSVVLLQATLATSPLTLRRLLAGHLNKIVPPRKHAKPEPDGIFRLHVGRDVQRSEVVALANLVASPLALRQYHLMRQALTQQAVRTFLGPVHDIKFGWPYANPAEIQVRGRSAPIDAKGVGDHHAFIVEQIEEVRTPLTFNKLVVVWPKGKLRTDDEKATRREMTLLPKRPAEPTFPLELVQDLHDLSAQKVALPVFGALRPLNLQVISEDGLDEIYNSIRVVPPSWEDDAGAFVPRGPNSDVTTEENGRPGRRPKELTQENVQRPARLVELEHFFKALAVLRSHGHAMQTLAVASLHGTDEVFGEAVNFFPTEIAGLRSWHLIKEGTFPQPRGFAIAEAQFQDRYHYFIDIQRKGEREHIGLGYVRSRDANPIEASVLMQFLMSVALSGWQAGPLLKDGEFIDTINHRPKKGASAFARGIAHKMTGVDPKWVDASKAPAPPAQP